MSELDKTQKQVLEFHEKFGSPINDQPTLLEEVDAYLRYVLIKEELLELLEAMMQYDLVGIADAIGDLNYVVNGAAVAYGFDLEQITDEIHRSNMTKVWPDGSIRKREDGKILKPDTFSPPNLAQFVEAEYGLIEQDDAGVGPEVPESNDGYEASSSLNVKERD